MPTVYFAWESEAIEFDPEVHARNDESVFSLEISQDEGDFAQATVVIVNPRVGLLGPSRPRWAMISYEDEAGGITPLFLGRIVGIPTDIAADLVQIEFIARSADYADQKAAAADELRVLPYYDPLFDESGGTDADFVLEGYAALWCVDRVTHEWYASHITSGEAGLISYTGDHIIEGSVKTSLGSQPSLRVDVTMQLKWLAKGSGTVDITRDVCSAFEPQTIGVYNTGRTTHQVPLLWGEGMIEAWPEQGDDIGGGWSVGQSAIGCAGVSPSSFMYDDGGDGGSQGVLVDLRDGLDTQYTPVWSAIEPSTKGTIRMFMPIFVMSPHLELDWSAEREYTEKVLFSLSMDSQPLVDEVAEVTQLELVADEATDELPGPMCRSYLRTSRGLQSLEYGLLRARAHMLMSARAVTLKLQVPFELGMDVTCMHNVSVTDPRLPGGVALGKVTSYSMRLDGDTGEALVDITLGCTVGTGAVMTATAGTCSYADSGYDNAAYQLLIDGEALVGSDVGYNSDDVHLTPINDDGTDLSAVGPSMVKSIVVTGGLDYQLEKITWTYAANQWKPMHTVDEVISLISGIHTACTVTLKPVTGGPFETTYEVTTKALVAPKMIDLS